MALSGNLYLSCIYTIRHSDELANVYASGGKGEFIENKPWTTGKGFLIDAHAKGRPLALVFGPAEAVIGLIYAAVITRIEIRESGFGVQTLCQYEHLTRIEPPLPLGRLWVINTQQPLDENFIRPYALCRTPEFLFELDWN